MEKRGAFLINFAYFAVITAVAFVLLRYGVSMLAPFVIAFVIAYLLKKPISFFRRKGKLPHKLAAIFVVLLFYVTVGTLITLLGIRVVTAIADLMMRLPALYQSHGLPYLNQVVHNLEALLYALEPELVMAVSEIGTQLISSLGQLITRLSTAAISFVSGVASSLPGLFIKLVLMVISSFFIAVDYEKLTGFCMRQLGDKAKAVFIQIKEYVVGTLLVCIRSYAIIMSITFVELSIGLSILKINHAVLVALCIAVFDILPVLGTGGVMVPWVVLTAIQGNFPLSLGLLVLYVCVTIIRNIIEPKIVGGQLGLHPVVTLASMFAGVQIMGGIGLFGFPIGLSLLRYLNDHGVIHILKDEKDEKE